MKEISIEMKILLLLFISFIILVSAFGYREYTLKGKYNELVDDKNTCMRILEIKGINYEYEKLVESEGVYVKLNES